MSDPADGAPSDSDPIRRLAEAVVFAPLGVGVRLVDDAPAVVRRIRNDLAAARMLGEMAVTRGVAQVRERLEAEASASTRSSDRSSPTPTEEDSTEPAEAETYPHDAEPADDVGVDEPAGEAPSVDELAIPDYDLVPAIDIVGQLAALTSAERAAVAAYERANRGRRTVLGKIDQLGGEA